MTDLPTFGWTPSLHAPDELLATLHVSIGCALDIRPSSSVRDLHTAIALAKQLPRRSIVHAHGIRAGWICALSSGFKPFTFITTLHNIPPKGYLGTAVLKVIASRSEMFVCVSREIAHCASLTRATVIPNGVDTAIAFPATRSAMRERLGLPQDRFIVLCAGRLSHEKGIDILLSAAKLLPDLLFLIAGEGPMGGQLRLSAPENATFLGHRDDVSALIYASDCVAIPSRSEGQGIAILEAFALATPVVAARVGGIPESVTDGETGQLVSPEDATALATSIKRIQEDPARSTAMAQRARLWVSEHRQRQAQSRKVCELYESLLDQA